MIFNSQMIVGNAAGELNPRNCFWLSETKNRDSVHLFSDWDLVKPDKFVLSCVEVAGLKNFVDLLHTELPTLEDTEKMILCLSKLKLGEWI